MRASPSRGGRGTASALATLTVAVLAAVAASGWPAVAAARAARLTAPVCGATVVRRATGAGPVAPVPVARRLPSAARPLVSAETTAPAEPLVKLTAGRRKATTGDPVALRVSVAPACPGAAVDLQVWDAHARAWDLLAALTLDGASRARWEWRPDTLGRHRLRARLPASGDLPAAVSDVRSVWVFDPGDPYGVPARYPHLILVDLSEYKLYYYEHGRAIRVFDCVLGRPSLPTPRGHFRIYAKDPHMAGPYGPRRMRYLGEYAIHGTDEPWLLERYPRDYSHGCTRLSNAHILWLYPRVPVGTPVWNVP